MLSFLKRLWVAHWQPKVKRIPAHLDGAYIERCVQMQRQRWAEQTATK